MPVDQPPPAPITEPSPCWSEPIVIDGIVMPTAPQRGNYPNERRIPGGVEQLGDGHAEGVRPHRPCRRTKPSPPLVTDIEE